MAFHVNLTVFYSVERCKVWLHVLDDLSQSDQHLLTAVFKQIGLNELLLRDGSCSRFPLDLGI